MKKHMSLGITEIRNSFKRNPAFYYHCGAQILIAFARPAGVFAGTFGDWMNFATEGTVRPFIKAAIVFFYAVGIVLAGLGIFKLVQKSKGQHGAQVSGGEVAAYFFGGCALCGLVYLIDTGFESLSGEGGVATQQHGIDRF